MGRIGMANTAETGLGDPIEFAPDTSSKKRKGVHRPRFADVFTLDGTTSTKPAKVHLLVNPFSGKKRGRAVATQVIDQVKQAGVDISASFSAYSGHLVALAAELDVGNDEVVAVVGGDGSLSEVITGRMQVGTDRSETFAIIPAGTGNSQANDLGLSSTEDAVEAM